jgi:hypothetical protein
VSGPALPVVFWVIVAVMIALPVVLAMRRWIPPAEDAEVELPPESIGDYVDAERYIK